MIYSVTALILAVAGIVSAADVPNAVEQFIEIRIEPWFNTIPSNITYGIGSSIPMIVNYGNTRGSTRSVKPFVVKVSPSNNAAAATSGVPVLYTLSYGATPSAFANQNDRICRGEIIRQIMHRPGVDYYNLLCSDMVRFEGSFGAPVEVPNFWTLDEVTPGQGILTMRGANLASKSMGTDTVTTRGETTGALFACADPDWERMVVEGLRATLNYYMEPCELHDQVRLKLVYRVVV